MSPQRRHASIAALACAAAAACLMGCSRKQDPAEPAHLAEQALPAASRVATAPGQPGPGDPVNMAIASAKEDLLRSIAAAGWVVADPVDKVNTNRMVRAVLAMEPYPTAPVSPLELLGRPQDFAIEQAAGPTPASRHHARLWDSGLRTKEGTPVWLVSATFDKAVAKSLATGKFTHEIAPEVDVERDKLAADLAAACKSAPMLVEGFGQAALASNADGFAYSTDRKLAAIDCAH